MLHDRWEKINISSIHLQEGKSSKFTAKIAKFKTANINNACFKNAQFQKSHFFIYLLSLPVALVTGFFETRHSQGRHYEFWLFIEVGCFGFGCVGAGQIGFLNHITGIF
jgi:hypothetical protein